MKQTSTDRSFARRIDLASLQLFVAVCELGSIGRAAEQAHLAASAVSKRLSDLEAAAGDSARFFALLEAFHLRVLALADNKWRLQMVRDLRKVMKLHRQHSLQKAGRLQASLAEHAALMAALAARDGDRAASCMRQHFRSGLEAAS